MQKRGLARWVHGQPRLEEKKQEPLSSFEEPSKNHRNITLTTPEPPASSILAKGWALAERAEARRRRLGMGHRLRRRWQCFRARLHQAPDSNQER